MQQHSQSPQSMHRVLPVASAGLTMLSNVEDAALPGPLLRLTRAESEEELQAIFYPFCLCFCFSC
ncbi:hypothetical protein F4782DRAFT_475769 [Xylaria castorea]|nr:hypothetical protein F4782DRAFT_475769 [Xylaria castorea]